MVKGYPADFTRIFLFPLPVTGGKENRFSLSPPPGRKGSVYAVSISFGISGNMMDLDILNRPSVTHPDSHRTGAIPDYTVAEYHVPDVSPCFRSYF